MQAFKLYFRVIARGSAATIGVYFVLFSLLVFMFSSMEGKTANLDSYQARKVNTILVNRDDSELSNGWWRSQTGRRRSRMRCFTVRRNMR